MTTVANETPQFLPMTRTIASELLNDVERAFQNLFTVDEKNPGPWRLLRGGATLRYETEELLPIEAATPLPMDALRTDSIPVICAMAPETETTHQRLLNEHLRKIGQNGMNERLSEIQRIRQMATPFTRLDLFVEFAKTRNLPFKSYAQVLSAMHSFLLGTSSDALTAGARRSLLKLLRGEVEARKVDDAPLRLRVHVSKLRDEGGVLALMPLLIEYAQKELVEAYMHKNKDVPMKKIIAQELFFLLRVQFTRTGKDGNAILQPREKGRLEEAHTIPTWIVLEFTLCPRSQCPQWIPETNLFFDTNTLWHIDLGDVKRKKEAKARDRLNAQVLLKAAYANKVLTEGEDETEKKQT